jgi:hypothetical protein
MRCISGKPTELLRVWIVLLGPLLMLPPPLLSCEVTYSQYKHVTAASSSAQVIRPRQLKQPPATVHRQLVNRPRHWASKTCSTCAGDGAVASNWCCWDRC